MNKRKQLTAQIIQQLSERTQLDWDIEDARYELLGSGAMEREQRKARQQSRLVYKTFLFDNIKHAVEAN